MRKSSRWGYLVFLAALVIGFTVYRRDFSIAMVLLCITLSDPLYRRLRETRRLNLLVPAGLVLAFVLGGLYYIADFIIFPHSPRAIHRLQDAGVSGLLWSFFGLLMAHFGIRGKPLIVDGIKPID